PHNLLFHSFPTRRSSDLWMQYLYDDTGRAYLDVYNNVPLVGHSHPRVVQAAQAQLGLLNTNTRYLHDNVNRYAERLTRLLPQPLDRKSTRLNSSHGSISY